MEKKVNVWVALAWRVMLALLVLLSPAILVLLLAAGAVMGMVTTLENLTVFLREARQDYASWKVSRQAGRFPSPHVAAGAPSARSETTSGA